MAAGICLPAAGAAGAAAAALAFQGHGSIEEASVTGASPGATLTVVNGAGSRQSRPDGQEAGAPLGSVEPKTMPASPCTSCAVERTEAFGECASAFSAFSAMARATGSLIGCSGLKASAATRAIREADAGPTVTP